MLAKEYFRKAAKPRKVMPTDPQEVWQRQPTMSIDQMRRKQLANEATQRALWAPPRSAPADLVNAERGEMLARRKAHSRVNFEAYDAERDHIESVLDTQRQYTAGKNLMEQTGELMNLQKK